MRGRCSLRMTGKKCIGGFCRSERYGLAGKKKAPFVEGAFVLWMFIFLRVEACHGISTMYPIISISATTRAQTTQV